MKKPNDFFFSPKLAHALSGIFHVPMTVLSAPVGYGKKVAVSRYLLSTNAAVLWINLTKDESLAFFWDDFRDIFSEYGIEDLPCDFPEKTEDLHVVVRKLCSGISRMNGRACVLVVEGFRNIPLDMRRRICSLMNNISDCQIPRFHIVLLSAVMLPGDVYDNVGKSGSVIGTRFFLLGENEIKRLFASYGIALQESEIRQAEAFSEGWISALSALVIVTLELDKLAIEETSRRMTDYICKCLLNGCPGTVKRLLAAMHGFRDFSRVQATMLCCDAGMTWDDVLDALNYLVENCLLTEYFEPTGRYYIHNLMREIGRQEFDGLPASLQGKIRGATAACKGLPHSPAVRLTGREKEICFLLQAGCTYHEIGEQLYISKNTVKTIIKQIYQKLSIHSRKELSK